MNMKKMLSLALAGVMALSLMACSAQNGGDSSENTSSPSSSQSSEETQNNETPESVTITILNANKEAAELEVPYDPQRIAILDMASLDILDALGVGDRVVGTASTSLEYLQDYINDDIANLGTIKEADLEAVMACEPDVIFIGGRLASSYDALSEIAPVVYLATDTELGVVESVRQNATTLPPWLHSSGHPFPPDTVSPAGRRRRDCPAPPLSHTRTPLPPSAFDFVAAYQERTV